MVDDARVRGLAAGFALGAPAVTGAMAAEHARSGFRLVLVPALALVAHASRQFLEFRGGTQP